MTLVPVSAGVAEWVNRIRPAAELAELVAGTEFVPGAMRGNVPAVAACIMYGDEIGVGPMTALSGIHVIDGRPFPSAELMRALVLSAGHLITVSESSGVRCRVVGRRLMPNGTYGEAVPVEWTIEMARAAGLAGRGAWNRYPRALLLARASADLCRMAFPDVVKGLGHVPDAPDAADVSDWAEYAESLGPEPETHAPATETVQYTAPVAPVAPADTAPAGVTRLPWDDDDRPPVAPEPTPEPTPEDIPAADPKERPPDAPTRARIMASYADLPYGPDRDTRLAVFSAILGRPIATTNDLDRTEAYRLLGGLHDLRTGLTIAVDDGHGVFTIHAAADPPDENAP